MFKKKENKVEEKVEMSETELFTTSINRLNKNLTKYTSFKQVFYRGLVQGLATVLGATILAGLVVGILIQILNNVDYGEVPFINNLLEDVQQSAESTQNQSE